jgi:hypothetical protein
MLAAVLLRFCTWMPDEKVMIAFPWALAAPGNMLTIAAAATATIPAM